MREKFPIESLLDGLLKDKVDVEETHTDCHFTTPTSSITVLALKGKSFCRF